MAKELQKMKMHLLFLFVMNIMKSLQSNMHADPCLLAHVLRELSYLGLAQTDQDSSLYMGPISKPKQGRLGSTFLQF